MKKALVTFAVVFISGLAYADSKLTTLTADTTAQGTDLLYKVDNPGGTPTSRSISVTNLLGAVAVSSFPMTGVTAGTYGNATNVSSVTVGADGRVTGAANVAIALSGNAISGGTFGAVNGSALTNLSGANVGSGVPAANIASGSLGNQVIASSIAISGVTAGTYGNATNVSSVTVGADGRVTGATNVAIAISGNAVSGGTFGAVNGSALTNLTAANINAGSLGGSVLASSFPVSGVTAGTYGTASNVSSFTVNAQGIVTKAANVAILISTTGLSATGASGTNFLRSDNTWSSPSGSGDVVTTATQTLSGANTFTSPSGLTVTYGISGGSLTLTGLPGAGTLFADASGHVSTTTASGGAQDFDLKDSTGAFNRLINLSTNPLVNVSSVSFSGTYDSGGIPWGIRPSTFSHVPGGSAGSITFTTSSSHTVEGLQFWAVSNSTFTGRFVLSLNSSSTNSAGFKFSMIGPATPVFFTMTGGGSGTSSTNSNFSQQAAALNTKTQTLIGTYSSGAMWFEFDFTLITGTTAGYVNVQLLPTSGAGNNFINSESYITAVQD